MAQLHLWCRNKEASERKLPSQSDSSKVGIDALLLPEHKLVSITEEPFNGNRYELQEIEDMPSNDQPDIAVEDYLKSVADSLLETLREAAPTLRDEFLCEHNKNPSRMKGLSQLLSSVNMRPDAFVQLSHDGVDGKIPLLMVEIQSGDGGNSYENTLNKATIGLIDQLRLLRHYSLTISKCSGFVFPKCSIYDSQNRVVKDNKMYVTEISVEWKDFRFCVHYAPLEVLEVGDHVLATMREMYSRCVTGTDFANPLKFLIPLSAHDMQGLCVCAGQDTCQGNQMVQLKSRASILVYCRQCLYLYKYVPSLAQENTLLFLTGRRRSSFILTPEEWFKYCNLTFFKFKKLPYLPLTINQAQRCLKDFVSGVHTALTVLHQSFRLAHLDIRLENICFDQVAYQAADQAVFPVLIDLDRATEVDTKANNLLEKRYGDSLLYGRPVEVPRYEWTMEHTDLKQFGKRNM